MARHGVKKFDRWEITIERMTYGVDVFLLRPQQSYEVTKFRAENKEIELRIEHANIDELRKLATEHVRAAGKREWSRWIRYWVKFDTLDADRGDKRTEISVRWQLIERCDIGTATERFRDIERDRKAPTYGRIETGGPHSGYELDYQDKKNESEFTGCIPYTPEAIAGLEALATGIRTLYGRLESVLLPGKKTNPAAWLITASKSGAPMLPAGKEGK